MESRKYYFEIRTSSLIAVSIGFLVILGWLFNIEVFKSVIVGLSTMKFNTALCFLLTGSSLYFFTNGNWKVSAVLSLTVLIFSLIAIVQDLFGLSLGIDEFFVIDSSTRSSGLPHPGRMSPTGSLCFILTSFSILSLRSQNNFLRIVMQYTLHMVSLVSFIAILGYLYDVPSFYKLSFFVSMAVHTAFTFLMLSVAVSLLNPTAGLTDIFTGDEIGKVMARRVFPSAGIAILILGFIGIYLNRNNILSVQFDIALFTASFFIVSLLIIANTVKHLNKIDQKRSKAENSLSILNKTLEQKVEQRTEELAKSEEKFSKIFEMSPAGLIVSDITAGKFLDANQSFLDMTGYTRAEVLGKTSAQLGLILADDGAEARRLLSQQGGLKNHELNYYTKAGEGKNSLASVELIDIAGRKIALTVLYDITSLKNIESELKAARDLAEESSIAKERFMANMSHEIRTPMNAIIGFTNLIERTELSEDQQQYLSFIKNSGENLLVLINDILDYSKIEAGMMQLEKVPFHIEDLLQSIKIMFSEKAREKNLQLHTDIDSKVPKVLLGDPTRLTQILINLIGNAIKFTSVGSVGVNVKLISSDGDQNHVGIYVQDTGIGIPQDKQDDIFQRFMQASSETTRNYGGSGLGLSIVKRLVELQNGEITIDSEEGKGTLFKVKLPYQTGRDELSESNVPDQAPVDARKFARTIKILLAEDNVMNQVLARKVLSQFGCEVDIAENGGIAVEMVKNKSYDLILMDIQMPIMDGYASSKMIRNDVDKTVPIIAMTAHVMAGEREKCRSFGMNDYISKPFKVDALYAMILKYTGAEVVN